MTMIERVASAIRRAECSGALQYAYTDVAAAAIFAMLSPSDEMINAGLKCDAWANAEGPANEMLAATYQAMIEAELRATK